MKKPQALIGLLAALGTAIGVMVAVIGLPYGRADYSAFAEVYHGTAFAGGTVHIAVDTDVTTAATESNTNVPVPGPATVAADVTIHNETGASTLVAAVNFNLLADGGGAASRIDAVTPGACPPPGTTCNPDFSESGLPGAGWSCAPPSPDDDIDNSNANGDEQFISCSNASDPPSVAGGGGMADIARITYNVVGGLGVSPLVLNTVNVADELGVELLACNPGPGPCFDGSFTFIPPPPATETPTSPPTNTPAPATSTFTPTNTLVPTDTPIPPTGSGLDKIPESCLADGPDGNTDLDAIPAPLVVAPANGNCVPGTTGTSPSLANLWICEDAACTGVGEGSLKVYEVASGVPAPCGPPVCTPGGVSAYEFSVEYDNFVISSVNPCDIVFGPGGAGAVRGPVNELDTSAVNNDCDDDTGADNLPPNDPANANGTCNFSHILENIVHFGCVTAADNPAVNGPGGTFTVASLLLIPHEDLTADLFPGNDNGVVTILKDNGCELVDAFGHPVPGSINGGLTSWCQDLAVTVRILEGDLDLDCTVEVTDAQAIAGHYGAFFGSLLYSKWLDLEPNLHDLDIDIKDIQKVFGRIGSDCQNPVPQQTPVPFN